MKGENTWTDLENYQRNNLVEMKGIFIHKKSPYYWMRYYDILEPNSAKKRKEHNTKIEVTPADRKRFEERKPGETVKYQGTPELWRKVKELKAALADRKFEQETNSHIVRKMTLTEGYAEFKAKKTVPGIKGGLKLKTLINYDIAVEHMKTACGDKYIYKYTDKEYEKLLNAFEDKKIKRVVKAEGKKEYEYKNLSANSRSMYTRALRSLWKYFVDKGYTRVNIIEAVEGEEKDPDPIPPQDMQVILDHFKSDTKHPERYWIVLFMLLTGCRPSSAIVQKKDDISFTSKRITIRNVKAGKRKKKPLYMFPLYKELHNLLQEDMGIKEGTTGRLFHMYSVVPENYTWPLSFWKRAMASLCEQKKISATYNLKQLRPTFLSFLINTLRMDIYMVFKLADHADIKVTDKNYISFRVDSTREILDDVEINDFFPSEETKPAKT